jgi:3-oxoadipate enol-lactonase/4-carboxymuconolactone decarboxylase
MDEIAAAVAATGLSERCRAERPELVGLFMDMIASNDPASYADWAAATGPAEMVDLDRVSCPVLAACGELDPVAPPAFCEAIAAGVADGRVAVIPGAAHWCQIEAPKEVNQVLVSFLATAIPALGRIRPP